MFANRCVDLLSERLNVPLMFGQEKKRQREGLYRWDACRMSLHARNGTMIRTTVEVRNAVLLTCRMCVTSWGTVSFSSQGAASMSHCKRSSCSAQGQHSEVALQVMVRTGRPSHFGPFAWRRRRRSVIIGPRCLIPRRRWDGNAENSLPASLINAICHAISNMRRSRESVRGQPPGRWIRTTMLTASLPPGKSG